MTDNKLGRPPLSETEPTVKTSVTLTLNHVKFLKDYGLGNISLGVRRLVDEKRAALPNEEGPV